MTILNRDGTPIASPLDRAEMDRLTIALQEAQAKMGITPDKIASGMQGMAKVLAALNPNPHVPMTAPEALNLFALVVANLLGTYLARFEDAGYAPLSPGQRRARVGAMASIIASTTAQRVEQEALSRRMERLSRDAMQARLGDVQVTH
jgi:hypothetical protein